MKKIVIPEGMLNAACFQANSGRLNGSIMTEDVREILVSTFRWLAENVITPTREQLQSIADEHKRGQVYPKNITTYVEGFQRLMFLDPTPEVPEEIKDLFDGENIHGLKDFKSVIIEAYNRGRKYRGEK